MSIGEAASCLGVAVATLRRWHKDGRLHPKTRTPGGHRRYDAGDVAGHRDARTKASWSIFRIPRIGFTGRAAYALEGARKTKGLARRGEALTSLRRS